MMKQSLSAIFARYAYLSWQQALDEQHSTKEHGLSTKEAQDRLKRFGSNQVTSVEKQWWRLLIDQFMSPFVLLFLAVAFLLFCVHELVNGVIVLVFVAVNALVGFFQEYRAAKTLHMLNHYLVMSVIVRRDGKELLISSNQLVPGDIIELYPGEHIPADIRLIDIEHFFIDESVLTGESVPVAKTVIAHSADDVTLFNASSIAFAGTTVVSGKAVGLVFATGNQTQMGSIACLSTQEPEKPSSLVAGTMQLGKFIMRFVAITMTVIFIANVLFKTEGPTVLEFLIFAVTLALSVLPEALPIVVSFCLSRGVARLATLNVIVKRLSAVEDLGGMEILCTDKTGTLTENKMSVSALYPANNRQMLLYGAMASVHEDKAEKIVVHSFDAAFCQALTADESAHVKAFERCAEIPFDPIRLRNLILVASGNAFELIVRGMPEAVMALCNNLSVEEKSNISSWLMQEGQKGNRIIAVATKTLAGKPAALLDAEAGKDFIFHGLVAFSDPLKKTARAAIQKAEKLGVQVKILSGDSKEVCGAVAFDAGLINDIADVVTGTEFAALSFEHKQEVIQNRSVFARILPEQKYEIVQMLRAHKVVGYIGDGINDAPALKAADVSIAVSSAANVAREAADVLLLSTSLFAVVQGVEEGRKIVTNTLKYTRTTLSANFGNFYAVAAASLFVNYLPMKPAHILLVNLLSDFPMIAIATDTVDKKELLAPKRFSIKGMMLIAMVLGLISTVFDFVFFLIFHQFSPAAVQTGWFIESIFTEVVFIFSIRTKGLFFKQPWPSMPLLMLGLLAMFLALLLPNTALGQSIFGFAQLSLSQLLLIVCLVSVYFCVTELVKMLYYKRLNN